MKNATFLAIAIAVAGCNPSSSDTRGKDNTDNSADSESAIPPKNVSGTYLACHESGSDSDVFTLKCNVHDEETGKVVAISQGYESFSWDVQKKDLRLDIKRKIFPSTGSLQAEFHGLSYSEAKTIAFDSQIKLQLFKDQNNYLLSDLISPERGSGLPKDFTVYSINGAIINHYVEGSTPLTLPTTFAPYKGLQGCYLACYSNDDTDAVYPVAENIFVKGQYRIEGTYEENICRPLGFETANLADLEQFKSYCTENVPSCSGGGCWSGGDTGGWFGLLPASSVTP